MRERVADGPPSVVSDCVMGSCGAVADGVAAGEAIVDKVAGEDEVMTEGDDEVAAGDIRSGRVTGFSRAAGGGLHWQRIRVADEAERALEAARVAEQQCTRRRGE